MINHNVNDIKVVGFFILDPNLNDSYTKVTGFSKFNPNLE